MTTNKKNPANTKVKIFSEEDRKELELEYNPEWLDEMEKYFSKKSEYMNEREEVLKHARQNSVKLNITSGWKI